MTTTIDLQTGELVDDPMSNYLATLTPQERQTVDERTLEKQARARGETLNSWLDWNYEPDNIFGWSRSDYRKVNLAIAIGVSAIGYGIYRTFGK